ncbi:hypothetical protein BDY21DRAFT_359369 [Lineolata rhizophorae]|uniref:Kama family protein n=1 Tax=Lineolata rhizophorae TaxID=578093 RepID=A0A6A6NL08_9PEZI|nr:hypothetical protein BDY21DRAFT_359369 [Lineolata rhizophorae]
MRSHVAARASSRCLHRAKPPSYVVIQVAQNATVSQASSSYGAPGYDADIPPPSILSKPTASQNRSRYDPDMFWRKVRPFRNVNATEFLSTRWQRQFKVNTQAKLEAFINEAVPEVLPPSKDPKQRHIRTKGDFIDDIIQGMPKAGMNIGLTPYFLSIIDWTNPLGDPVLRQCLPQKSLQLPDHPMSMLDSLSEKADSPFEGLVHRYPHKILFLAATTCPSYCVGCTRSYAVGPHTDLVNKSRPRQGRRAWQRAFDYIHEHPEIADVVVSGGDTYELQPEHLREIAESLFAIPHINRFRFATRGLSFMPMRILDPQDGWARAVIDITRKGRELGKEVAVHTQFNHPHEISWVTEEAARLLFKEGVIVRNQTVLGRGINDNVETMGALIRGLADINFKPYYVYQADMVQFTEHMRTPLSTILRLEKELRGTIAGHCIPHFVVDLPGGGGKRLAQSYERYENGVAEYISPVLKYKSEKPDVYKYYDPLA